MFKDFIDKIKNKYFDYDIVGEYLNTDGDGHYQKKYIKKYYLKCLKKKKGGRK